MSSSAASPYARRVHRVMDHVRQHLDDDLSLHRLAKVAHFSPYHFHRVFKATTGETLTAFVQRARLERAAYLMMATPERPLTSIALEVGFSTPSDFSRVFRRRYGLAPTHWDRASRLDEVSITDNFDELVRQARAAGPEPLAHVDSHAACSMIYVRMRTPFIGPALREGYAELTSWLETRGIDWRVRPLLGLSWDHYETTPIDRVSFDFGFAVDGLTPEPPFGVHELPAMDAVGVRCRGPLARIAVAWDFLYREWLPSSDYEPADLPAIKRFRQRPDVLGWDQWDVDCTVPLRRALP